MKACSGGVSLLHFGYGPFRRHENRIARGLLQLSYDCLQISAPPHQLEITVLPLVCDVASYDRQRQTLSGLAPTCGIF